MADGSPPRRWGRHKGKARPRHAGYYDKRQTMAPRHYRRANRILAIDLAIGKMLYPESTPLPRTRAECPKVRPCPFVSCRWNLYLEVSRQGHLRLPIYEPWQQDPRGSCALEVADRGTHSVAEVARIMNCTPQAIACLIDDVFRRLRTDEPEVKEVLR